MAFGISERRVDLDKKPLDFYAETPAGGRETGSNFFYNSLNIKRK